jgi:hypothetical protein
MRLLQLTQSAGRGWHYHSSFLLAILILVLLAAANTLPSQAPTFNPQGRPGVGRDATTDASASATATVHRPASRPRAAFVSLARESQLEAMVASMHQLEARFNRRYHYHWVFFSNDGFSETFRRVTSNATRATCVYEQIAAAHWTLPQWIHHPRYDADLELMCAEEGGHTCMQNDPSMYRWNSGLFAREKRLRDYDWFWKVEPGVSHQDNERIRACVCTAAVLATPS